MSCVQGDVDSLKLINDTWGHHIGDEAISHVIKHIRAALPNNHVFAGLVAMNLWRSYRNAVRTTPNL
ncbi:diguanylate cyclase domain-containing protein [Sulfobacillus thermosulfidooxidans]|uniref:diguanylate cyclase domain-containing protein n=1 Tax=Sulfobacillus thermosulfidooxidans TaxID=28034 RepID=UPI0002E02313|nr:diguanylate cyclase [Sulfobacillus thermosulfidooxidans]